MRLDVPMSCAVHTGIIRGNTKKNTLRVKKPLRGLFRGSDLGCFGLSGVAFVFSSSYLVWGGWFSVGIHKQPAKTGKGKDMSKAQAVDNLPNNFVMRSDSLYCCRTGEALLTGSDVNADMLTKLQSSGELETFGYPGSIMLPREAVSDAAVQYRWGKRSNGEYHRCEIYG